MPKATRTALMLLLMMAFLPHAQAQNTTPARSYTTVSLLDLTAARMRAFNFGEESSQEEPLKVSLCQLEKDPPTYNLKLIEVTGFVSHGFEDFGVFDPECAERSYIWLEYGGTAAPGIIYCCGVTAARSRPEPLVVQNIPIPLVIDERFRQFDRLIQKSEGSLMHATLVGRFFAGERVTYPSGETAWSGYGHMGCCSLLAIQQVVRVDATDRDDLDYAASADQPNINKAGCGYKDLVDTRPLKDLIEAQRSAELPGGEWMFDNPQRVASEALARLLKIDEKSLSGMRQTRKAQGRFVYTWKPKAKRVSYMIVVSRPYVLSFYAKDSSRVAWTVIAAYESGCGSDY
jgi:hypothetical protein